MYRRSLLLVTVGLASIATAQPNSAPPHAQLPTTHRELFEEHCVKCHGPEKQKGKFRVDTLPFTITTVEDADRWQKVLNSLNSGEMPPEDEKQPPREQKTEFLSALSHTLVAARKSLADQGGRITMRRLNRREYQNTIRDLLGVTVDAHDLPADGGAGSFDTVGTSLFMSSDQFERYLELGRRALDEAIVTGPQPQVRKEHGESEIAANRFVAARLRGVDSDAYARAVAWRDSGKPATEFGFTDKGAANFTLRQGRDNIPTFQKYLARPHSDTGAFLTMEVGHIEETIAIPDDAPLGDYLLRLRVGLAENAPAHRRFLEMGHQTPGRGIYDVIGSYQVTGTIAQPSIIEIPVHVSATSPRTFNFREKHHNSRAYTLSTYRASLAETGVGPEPTIWVDWVEWEGPIVPQWPPAAHRQLFFKGPGAAQDDAYAREIIERFARRAFRADPPEQDFLDKLFALYQRCRAAGDGFEDALKTPLSVVLASPGFLYLAETTPERGHRPLDDRELAIRLSYFIWSAPPDEELLTLAKAGKLHDPATLAAQVDRLISHPRSREFVRGFTHQWLGMERLDFFQFDFRQFRDFDESAKIAARDEVFAFVDTLLRENLSAKNLLKSDFAVVNSFLATYYGLPGVEGDAFRKVSLPADSPRGGLLGMAAILAMGSNGERTSPVERGAWVLRKLLNDPPPPAPPNVPQLTRLDEKLLTTRQRLLAHQEEAQCASCHRQIDPIGFGLENFDAAGLWRTKDAYDLPDVKKKNAARAKKIQLTEANHLAWDIDPSGAFYRGASFGDYFALRDLVAGQSDRFARGLTEALMEYALGRTISFTDEDLIQTIVAQTKDKDFAFRSFIHAIVASDAFHRK